MKTVLFFQVEFAGSMGMGTRFLLLLIFFFLLIILCLTLFLFFYLNFKKGRAAKAHELKKHFERLIGKAIFFEEGTGEKGEEGQWMPVPQKFHKMLGKPFHRRVIIGELIHTKKNLSGEASENLRKLYEKLGLDRDSRQKLKNGRWYMKARGILELSAMDQKDCLLTIYKLTNHKNEFVRMEAQSAIINFAGAEGLRFLDIISYPLLPWQQIKLLDQLSSLRAESFPGIEKWLVAENDSVVLFALRLVRIYHRFELHDAAAKCLTHRLPEIRQCAVETLMHIYEENTASLILENYENENKSYQLMALKALKEIGPEENIPFLTGELGKPDDDIKLAAARALAAATGKGGITLLESWPSAQVYPWKEIIQQVKGEQAA